MTPHCWHGRIQDIEERFGSNSAEYLATFAEGFMDGSCMLEDGHDGPHEFVDDDKIGVTFEEAEK